MIYWKIWKTDIGWRYRIDYEYSQAMYRAATGSPINPAQQCDCIDAHPIEYRRVKFLKEKMLDVNIHLKELSFQSGDTIARELLGI